MENENSVQLIAGINPVREALVAGRSFESVTIQNDLKNQRLFEILKIARQRKIPVNLVPHAKLDKIYKGNHQGVLARCSVKEYASLDTILIAVNEKKESPFLLIPEGVEDPQNLGALVRTALCAGMHGIILPRTGAAGLSYGTEKASAGAITYMDITRVNDMPATLKSLKEQGIRIVGCESGQGRSLHDADLSGPIALVLGGENVGIRPHVRRNLDEVVHIPSQGPIGSLNVSAAGAVVIFEAVRQRACKAR